MPGVRIVEVEEPVGGAVDVDEISVVVITVLRIESELECSSAAIEDSEGAEVCIASKRGSLAQDVCGALQQENWTRKDDREQHSTGECVTVIGDRAECNPCAEGHAAGNWLPFRQIGNTIAVAVIPVAIGWQRIPRLARRTIGFHVHRKQSGGAIHAEARCK